MSKTIRLKFNVLFNFFISVKRKKKLYQVKKARRKKSKTISSTPIKPVLK